MADQHTSEGPSTSNVSSEGSESSPSTVKLASEHTSEGPSISNVSSEGSESSPSTVKLASEHTSEGPSTSNVSSEGSESSPSTVKLASEHTSEGPSTSNVSSEGSESSPSTVKLASEHTSECPSTSNVSSVGSESSPSTVNINIKTLDSRTYAFDVDKNMQVSALKEKVATETGVPVAQQRLIFRGKALMDDHILSEYHLENGDTLHLVIRQPSQPQLSSSVGTGETTPDNGLRGQEPATGAPRNRIGQVSHSVVLGTINVGEQGDGLVPDLNRVIGAVLNSIGVGSQTGANHPGLHVNARTAAPRGNETEGIQRNSGSQSQQPGQAFPRISLAEGMQIPLGAAIAVPSLNMPIPDSLHTLTVFMNRMESVLSRNGNQPNQSPADSSSVDLPTNSRGQSTLETLSTVMRHTERLVGNHVTSALSRTAGRLEQEGNSTDLTVRGQIQAESVQLGLVMQHLGAQFLELGRTMLTLRMGESPAESSVNAGPAVYISPSGPNPIMVQPFPLQTYSLFSGPSVQSNPGGFNPFGIGSAARNVNIHIHTVGSRATNGDGAQGDHASGTDGGDSSQSRAPPVIGTTGVAVSSIPRVSFSGASQHGQPESTTVHEQSTSSGAETEARKFGESQIRGECDQVSNETSVSSAGGSQGVDRPGASSSVPIGLGMGDLQPKRRVKQSKSQGRSDDGAATSSQGEQPIRDEQVLQSLAALSARRTEGSPPLGQFSHLGSGGNGQPDISNMMSQVLQNPALNGLLGGISQQTGLGSPDTLRDMLQQFTQNPGMMNTVNQIAQQIDPQDLGSMFAGFGGAGHGGGGMDLSSIFQQMMPLVSQALGGVPTSAQQAPGTEVRTNETRANREVTPTNENTQIGLQEVAQRIEHHSPPEEIFRSVVENAAHLHRNGGRDENLVNGVCSTEGLANEFMEVLHRDISKRVRDESKPPRKPS
ncbi:ubiquitin-like domain-containing protein CIP73 isoform X3 [Ipomoea triloba]|uniref:ubiquitin-like domain-containing protein CIP73 isoform X3 n=1 Tax=Ipomoea triloba TaxID=35885 RepID=UPI00125E158E|nr:ubiquitin-like domain-containing protein CIP73 isoform X3 [Ipomoea triloba]